MPQTFETKRKLLILGSPLLLFTIFSGCNQQLEKYPQGRHAKPQPPQVEQELLATINTAENLEQGNPLLVSGLYSLANYYHDRKEYDKAAHQFQRILHIKEQINGPNHPDVAAILQRYARVLQQANRPTEATNLLARANAILSRSTPRP